jgi:hypothetical protein
MAFDNLGDDRLSGRAAIAEYYIGNSSPEALRRVTALLNEVKIEDRIPHYREAGKPTSFKSWIKQWTLERRERVLAKAREAEAARPPRKPIVIKRRLTPPARTAGRPEQHQPDPPRAAASRE